MSDSNGLPPDDPNVDPGEPIADLVDFEVETSSRFLPKLRNKIDRRTTTSHILSFAWEFPKMVVLQFLEMIFHILGSRDDRKGGTS